MGVNPLEAMRIRVRSGDKSVDICKTRETAIQRKAGDRSLRFLDAAPSDAHDK
jgi:hypothetical protein